MTSKIIETKIEELDIRLKNLEESILMPITIGGITGLLGVTGVGLCATAESPGQFITGGVLGVIGGTGIHYSFKDFLYQFSDERKNLTKRTREKYERWVEIRSAHKTSYNLHR
jgi:hypothetical protein